MELMVLRYCIIGFWVGVSPREVFGQIVLKWAADAPVEGSFRRAVQR